MAIEWADGFELGSSAAILARYESTFGSLTLSSTSGRTGQYVILGAANFRKTRVRAVDNIVVGIARKVDGWAEVDFLYLFDTAGNLQITMREMSDGTIRLYRGDPATTGVLLATSAAITAGFWIYYELRVVVHPTLGQYELRVNGTTMFTGTAANTQNTALNNIYYVEINGRQTNGGTPVNNRVDDLYIADNSNPIPLSGFYGNVRVEALFPNAFGTITGWTPFGNASNWQNVDENPHNSDTDYNYTATQNASDLYGLQNISTPTGTVRAVQVTYVARKDDALQRVTAPLIRTGGTTYVGGNDSLTTSYVYYEEMWNFNPNTSDLFSLSEVNSLEAGIEVTG